MRHIEDLIRSQKNLQFHFWKLILDFEHKYHTSPTTAKQLALNQKLITDPYKQTKQLFAHSGM